MWPAFAFVSDDPNAWKNLDYVGHHLPFVGPVILEGMQQSKQHPRITNILRTVKPDI